MILTQCRFDQEAFRGFDRGGNERVDSQIDPDNRPDIAAARREQDTTVREQHKDGRDKMVRR